MPRTPAQKRREGLTRSPKRSDQLQLHNEGRSAGKYGHSQAYILWRKAHEDATAARIQAELAAMEQQHPKE